MNMDTKDSSEFDEAKISEETKNEDIGDKDSILKEAGRKVFYTEEAKLYVNENNQKMINEFIIGKTIGHGAFSKVKQVVRQFEESGQLCMENYAMKVIHKPTLRKERAIRYKKGGEMDMINNLDKVYNEVDIWSRLNFPNIVKLYELIDDENHDYMYLVTELADMGQLSTWNYQIEKYENNEQIQSFILKEYLVGKEFVNQFDRTECIAKIIFYQLLEALQYLHEEALVIHRDLKLDNILLSSKDSKIKLTDFTVSRELEPDMRCFDTEGTPAFTAPECIIVAEDGYLPVPTDIWSYGVCLFTYIDGRVPFYAEGELEMQIKLTKSELECPAYFSADLKDLLEKVLSKRGEERPSATELLSHRWFTV